MKGDQIFHFAYTSELSLMIYKRTSFSFITTKFLFLKDAEQMNQGAFIDLQILFSKMNSKSCLPQAVLRSPQSARQTHFLRPDLSNLEDPEGTQSLRTSQQFQKKMICLQHFTLHPKYVVF